MKEKRPLHILTPAEVRQLIAQCSTRAPTGVRDAALIAVLYRGGLRLSEALALYARDFNRERSTLRVHNRKGHKPRTVGLDAMAVGLIDRWRATKTERGLNPQTTLLFCTLQGGTIASPGQIRDILKRRAKKASFDKRVHPHGLRHTHTFELIVEGVPLNALQKQLGHSSLATTSIYVDHLDAGEVIEIGRHRAAW